MNARKSLALSFAQRCSEHVLSVVSVVVLARLLTPEEIGVFTAGATIVGLGSLVSKFGLRQYLIQERELSIERRRTALGVCLVTSWTCVLLILATVALAPAMLWGGGDLRTVLLVLALWLALQPFVMPTVAVLQRQMMFGALYIINTLGALASVVAVIVLAWWGLGALSLAWARLADVGMRAALAMAYRGAAPWVGPSLAGWRRIFRFSAALTTVDGLREVADSAVRLVIAQILGYGALGLLSHARNVTSLFDRGLIQAVSPVALPLLALRVRQGQGLKQLYLMKLAYLSGLAWPFFGFLALFADPIVYILLGSQWGDVVPLIRILCLEGLLLPFTGMVIPFLVALGMIDRYVPVQILVQVTKLLLVLPLSFISLELACLGLVAPDLAKAVLVYPLLKRQLGYRGREVLPILIASALTTAVSLLIPVAVILTLGLESDHKSLPLLIASLGLGAGWLAGVTAAAHPLRLELTRFRCPIAVKGLRFWVLAGGPVVFAVTALHVLYDGWFAG